mmetsp:Transcript_23978/g.44012  ORF Transcript_23978/g.44012 Transcript_23978/m.44012 type:complete len:218 (+) Transcript_23978:65-718(+)
MLSKMCQLSCQCGACGPAASGQQGPEKHAESAGGGSRWNCCSQSKWLLTGDFQPERPAALDPVPLDTFAVSKAEETQVRFSGADGIVAVDRTFDKDECDRSDHSYEVNGEARSSPPSARSNKSAKSNKAAGQEPDWQAAMTLNSVIQGMPSDLGREDARWRESQRSKLAAMEEEAQSARSSRRSGRSSVGSGHRRDSGRKGLRSSLRNSVQANCAVQ